MISLTDNEVEYLAKVRCIFSSTIAVSDGARCVVEFGYQASGVKHVMTMAIVMI